MPNHSDAVRAAREAVVEAAITWKRAVDNSEITFGQRAGLDSAVDALLALEAATCPRCKGTGEVRAYDFVGHPFDEPCGCDHGRLAAESGQ